jgi:RNA polymerase sigma-70 factor (ECF subfamily)
MPSGDESERAAVRRVLAGDIEAFAEIVDRWQGPLVKLAYRFCRHRGQAEEMAQDAFLRAFRALDQWRGDAAFSTWLFALSINTYRSHLRRARLVEVPLDTVHPVASPGAEDQMVTRDVEEVVRRTVAALPGKYRDAMIVFYFMEQDLAEAARCLGVPEGTLKARLHRGRALLKKRLSRMLTTTRRGANAGS